jgi:hypothetical protein
MRTVEAPSVRFHKRAQKTEARTRFGIAVPRLPGIEPSVAWQAHIGGFLAGLILFASAGN